MAKYLIQDIIPPEKRHHATHLSEKKSVKVTSHNSISHPEHPITIIKPHKSKPISEAFPENPRNMIADQMSHADIHKEEHEEQPTRTSAPISTGAEGDTPDIKMWSYAESPEERAAIGKRSESVTVPPRFSEYTPEEGGGLVRWWPWLLGTVVIIVAGVLLLNYFAGATVTIVPKHETTTMDERFTAIKNATGADLPYAIMSTTTSLSIEVPATGEKTVTTKASGKIVVYNEQTVAQRLIKNTRFESPTGKIYRINDSITVPKASISGGKTTPGSLEVTVYADEAGPEYNIAPTDFTLPGLKSSPTFKKVYARSKGPMTGGASGTIKTGSDQDLKQAGEDLRVQLETKLRSKARGDLAPFQITFDQAIVVELGQPTLSKAEASATNKAVVTEEGRIVLVVWKRADLTKAIVKKLVENYGGEEVAINNLDTLQFAMNTQKGDVLMGGAKLDFTLKGTPELSWVINEEAIKAVLLGISKDSFVGILAQYPSVERAEASVRPMWKRSFPDDPERISVVLKEGPNTQAD